MVCPDNVYTFIEVSASETENKARGTTNWKTAYVPKHML